MAAQVREAGQKDLPALVSLMAEFYEEAGFPLSPEAAEGAFATILDNPRLGLVWLIEVEHDPVGYVVLTLGFSMEYGGLRGFVDDLFVRPEARSRGLGKTLLETVKQTCRSLGVCSLLVETGPSDHPARCLYARAGFEESGRVLLCQALRPALRESCSIGGGRP